MFNQIDKKVDILIYGVLMFKYIITDTTDTSKKIS